MLNQKGQADRPEVGPIGEQDAGTLEGLDRPRLPIEHHTGSDSKTDRRLIHQPASPIAWSTVPVPKGAARSARRSPRHTA